MEITHISIAAPDAEALGALVGQLVVVSFSTGAVIGASGLTALESVHGGRVTLATRGDRREASISLIERISTVAIPPARKGRVLDVDLKAGA
jgi:hypothetical protein